MFHDVTADVISGLILIIIPTATVALYRWLRNTRRLLVWMSTQMANDGNGSWRSNIDKRLTAIEVALPGVLPKPELTDDRKILPPVTK